MELEDLLDKLKDREDEVIDLASKLIKIPSVNPPGDMTDIAGYIKDFLSEHGLRCDLREPKKGAINVISGYGWSRDIHLMLNGHMDVVPVGEDDKWRYPPFGGVVRDGYIYGRGASDMKGPLAALISAYVLYVENMDPPEKSVVLTLVPDEETGSRFGTRYLIEELEYRPRYVLIAEPSTLYAYNMGEKGILWFRVKVKGVPGHASTSPYLGDNAILKSTDLIKDIYELTKLDFEPPDELREIARVSGELISQVMVNEELKRLFVSLSCNVGMIRGGVKTNVIAPNCDIDFDMRIPHGLTKEKVLELVRGKVSKYDGDVDVEMVAGEDPSYTHPDSALIKVIESSVRRELDVTPAATLIQGATDARHFRMVGSDAIIYGPAEWGGIHGYDERVKVKDLISASRIYLRIIYEMMR